MFHSHNHTITVGGIIDTTDLGSFGPTDFLIPPPSSSTTTTTTTTTAPGTTRCPRPPTTQFMCPTTLPPIIPTPILPFQYALEKTLATPASDVAIALATMQIGNPTFAEMEYNYATYLTYTVADVIVLAADAIYSYIVGYYVNANIDPTQYTAYLFVKNHYVKLNSSANAVTSGIFDGTTIVILKTCSEDQFKFDRDNRCQPLGFVSVLNAMS